MAVSIRVWEITADECLPFGNFNDRTKRRRYGRVDGLPFYSHPDFSLFFRNQLMLSSG